MTQRNDSLALVLLADISSDRAAHIGQAINRHRAEIRQHNSSRRRHWWLHSAFGYGLQFIVIALQFVVIFLVLDRANDPEHIMGAWSAGFCAVFLVMSLIGFRKRAVFVALQALTLIFGLVSVFSIPDYTWFLYPALVLGAAVTVRGNRQLLRNDRDLLLLSELAGPGSTIVFDENFVNRILPPLQLKDESLQASYDSGRSAVAGILGIDIGSGGGAERHSGRSPHDPD